MQTTVPVQAAVGLRPMRERLMGAALIVTAVVMVIAVFLHPEDSPAGMAEPIWGPLHFVIFLGVFVVLIGVVRLYGLIADATGWLGLLAFVLTTLGMALFGGLMILEAAVLSVLATAPEAGMLLDEAGPLMNGPLGVTFLVTGALMSVGFIVFGLLLVRSRDLPRWAGPLLVVTPLFAFSPPLPDLLGRIAIVVFSIGLLGLGYGLWKLAGRG